MRRAGAVVPVLLLLPPLSYGVTTIYRVTNDEGGAADLDVWLGPCPYNAGPGCYGAQRVVQNGALQRFNATAAALIASGLNRMMILTRTYTKQENSGGQHDYIALNLRFFATSSDTEALCDEVTVLQDKEGDGLVREPVTNADVSDVPFGDSHVVSGPAGNRFWVEPYALRSLGGAKEDLPTTGFVIRPTLVRSEIRSRRCTAEEVGEGAVRCADHTITKTIHDRIEIPLRVRTDRRHRDGKGTVSSCWRAQALSSGGLVVGGLQAVTRGLGQVVVQGVLCVIAVVALQHFMCKRRQSRAGLLPSAAGGSQATR